MSEWDRILREEWYQQEKPEEIVVSFIDLLKRQNRKMHVLDVGCGAGRHQVYMAGQGLEAHGIDISKTGLNLTGERLRRQKSPVYLVRCDMNALPYVGSCFDAVTCLHAVYHQKLEQIQRTISEIHRTLRGKGLVLMNFLSKRTYSYGKGTEVEQDTFVEQEGAEKAVLHHFTDRQEIEHLFSRFQIIDLRLAEKQVEGKLRSRWIVTART
jgi:ubiquinone/menaquinone biosynthesis C-methylase UbiE